VVALIEHRGDGLAAASTLSARWTDSKIRVHAFYCVLALILASLLQRRAAQNGLAMRLHAVLRSLSDIQEVTATPAICLITPRFPTYNSPTGGRTVRARGGAGSRALRDTSQWNAWWRLRATSPPIGSSQLPPQAAQRYQAVADRTRDCRQNSCCRYAAGKVTISAAIPLVEK
jgi:hypothetical protein